MIFIVILDDKRKQKKDAILGEEIKKKKRRRDYSIQKHTRIRINKRKRGIQECISTLISTQQELKKNILLIMINIMIFMTHCNSG